MAIMKRTPGRAQTADINVTPMVDVMLVLLIIFMVITPMLQSPVTVTLAQARNSIQMPDASTEGALIVAVTHDGRIYFDTQQLHNSAELTQKVRDWEQNRVNKEVFVKADARARYKSVVDVVDNVRAAGVDQLGLLTEQRRGTGPGS